MLKSKTVLVWPAPLRGLHWLLVAGVAGAWVTRSQIGPVHERWGYLAVGVVVVRTVWGLRSTNPFVRFDGFVRPYVTVVDYLKHLAAGTSLRHLGHNPLGGWMILALLGMVMLLGVSGWLSTTDWLWGYAWLANLHAGLGWLLVTLIGFHIVGGAFSGWQHRENLFAAMLTGRKRPE